MSAVLPKSRTEADHESFALDSHGETARRVIDNETHDKLDAVISALGGSDDTDAIIYNVTVGTANTEFSQILPTGTKRFILRARNRSQIQIAYTSGDSGTNFITLRPGAVFEDSSFYLTQTIYFQCSTAGETVEIVAYT